jgi:outer membrane protein assembly factor BamB
VFSSPAVAGDLVFVGSCNGVVHAIDRGTGQARWKYNALADGGKRAEFHGTPVLTEELLVIASDDRSPDGIGFVYAFERNTGRVRWKYPAGAGVMADLVREGSRLYAVTLADELICLDVASGRLRWRFASGWVNEGMTNVVASPVVSGGRVAFGGQNGVIHTLDAKSGRLTGKRDVGARVVTPLVRAGGALYFGTADRRIHRLALDRSSAHAALGIGGIPFGPPTPIDDSIFLLVHEDAENATLKAVDLALKGIRASSDTPGGWSSARAYPWRDHALVGSARGTVAAFSANGSEQWTASVGGVVRGIGVTDEVLYVGTLKGAVVALRWDHGSGSPGAPPRRHVRTRSRGSYRPCFST